MGLSVAYRTVSHSSQPFMWWLLVVATSAAVVIRAASPVLWRESNTYPADYEHITVYVTQEKVALTGQKALTSGCGASGRPYKYRGSSHLSALRRVLGDRKEVWVGAVTATTPWQWEGGITLYRHLGLSTTERFMESAVRIPGNNVFLCSLQCQQSSYLLLQGIWCACANVLPETKLTMGKLLLCPGTYEEICGTQQAFSVYHTQLPEAVQWGNLVTVQRSYGTRAFLYIQQSRDQRHLQLLAEADDAAKKGYICNGTLLHDSGLTTHSPHLLVSQDDDARISWQDAKKLCENMGRQLLTVGLTDDISELSEALSPGQTYWVALRRRNASLWLDGSQITTAVGVRHSHGHPACLTMRLKNGSPAFSFESCTGVQLQVLCEKDNDQVHRQMFTHDAEGNHIVTGSPSTATQSLSDTEKVLSIVLVLLLLLTVTLVMVLWHRNRCLPPKQPREHQRWSGQDSNTVDSQLPSATNPGDDSGAEHTREDPNGNRQKETVLAVTGSACSSTRDAYGYAVVNKNKPAEQLTSAGNAVADSELSSSTEQRAVEYMQVIFPSLLAAVPDGQQPGLLPQLGIAEDTSPEARSRTSVASSETYSVLSYRRAIQRAWTGLKRTAYAHVIVGRPKSEQTGASSCKAGRQCRESDGVSVYDEARPVSPRVPCIDNLYDHADPVKPHERRTASYPDASMARPPGQHRKSESLV